MQVGREGAGVVAAGLAEGFRGRSSGQAQFPSAARRHRSEGPALRASSTLVTMSRPLTSTCGNVAAHRQEGELRPQLLDRFGMSVNVKTLMVSRHQPRPGSCLLYTSRRG